MPFRSLFFTAVVAPALLLVSCGDDDNPAGPGTPGKVKTWSGTYGGTDAEWAVAGAAELPVRRERRRDLVNV